MTCLPADDAVFVNADEVAGKPAETHAVADGDATLAADDESAAPAALAGAQHCNSTTASACIAVLGCQMVSSITPCHKFHNAC